MNTIIFYFEIIFLVVVFVALILIAGIKLPVSRLSGFELGRRIKNSDKDFSTSTRIDSVVSLLLIMQKNICMMLIVLFTIVSASVLTVALGIVITFAVALNYKAVSRLVLIEKLSAKLFQKYQNKIIIFANDYRSKISYFAGADDKHTEHRETHASSLEEVEHIIEHARDRALRPIQKKSLLAILKFDDKRVKDIMAPRQSITSISRTAMLGPLVLDDLHKSGLTRFPVTDHDLDHVVGVLSIENLLTLDTGKGTSTVEKSMQPQVYYVHQDQTLQQALTTILSVHYDLLVVTDDQDLTVGLISLSDIMQALMGQEMRDTSKTL